ncbi:MAG: hypothetical protein ACOC0U_05105 [Desulfovibrionales bacterium]
MDKYVFPLMDAYGNDYQGYVDDDFSLVILGQNGKEYFRIPGRVCYNRERCQDLGQKMERTGIHLPFSVKAEDEQAEKVLREAGLYILQGPTKGDGVVFPIKEVAIPALREYLKTVNRLIRKESPEPLVD